MIRELLSNMVPRVFFSGQKILKRGTESRGIYFILKGRVFLTIENTALVSLSDNSYFGDCLFLQRNSTFNYVPGDEDVRCLFIDRSAFETICRHYPYEHDILRKVAYQRNEYFNDIRKKF
mmetsp:Transcript_39402/g.35106  ORF Transcript_39402/g.35106 Transcript_39402/m.35106 type:complete len:120 (+) Transcript_39402:1784-2143(+)